MLPHLCSLWLLPPESHRGAGCQAGAFGVSRAVLVLLCCAALIFTQPFYAEAREFPPDPRIEIEGETLPLEAPVVIRDDRVFVPGRSVFEALGAGVHFRRNPTEIHVELGDLDLRVFPGSASMQRDQEMIPLTAPPFIQHGRLYLPVRAIAEAMAAEVSWNAERRIVQIRLPYFDGDVLALGEEHAQNRRPRIPFGEEERELLARLVTAEARGEPFEGLVAVAAVVLNRVEHPGFPNTIAAVIFQPGQFAVAEDGSIDTQAIEEAYAAVDQALFGSDPTQGALFFFNPQRADPERARTMKQRVRTVIGNHAFAH